MNEEEDDEEVSGFAVSFTGCSWEWGATRLHCDVYILGHWREGGSERRLTASGGMAWSAARRPNAQRKALSTNGGRWIRPRVTRCAPVTEPPKATPIFRKALSDGCAGILLGAQLADAEQTAD
jgi:hypothetical protein